MPRVSVVLPVYNSARTVGRAIRSILAQTLRDIELIVHDDGSTDETCAVINAIDDQRMRYVRGAHAGVSAATNAATELATSPYIARMDADDFAYPHRLEQQLQLLAKKRLDVVGCQVRIVDEMGNRTSSLRRYENWINVETLESDQITALRFVEFPLVNPTLLAKRQYFEHGFAENAFPEDYDLMLSAAAMGLRFGKVAEVLFDWTDHTKRLTRTHSRYSLEAFMNCRRWHLLAGPLRGVDCVDLWGMGSTGKPWLHWLQSQGITVRRGYDVNERKAGTMIHNVPVLLPANLPPADGTPLLIAVGAENARNQILPQIRIRGYVSGHDAWFVA